MRKIGRCRHGSIVSYMQNTAYDIRILAWALAGSVFPVWLQSYISIHFFEQQSEGVLIMLLLIVSLTCDYFMVKFLLHLVIEGGSPEFKYFY